jgi:hypothetical protein
VFLLFAQMVDDLEWLISNLALGGNITECSSTLITMIRARPLSERAGLKSLISMHVGFDDALLDGKLLEEEPNEQPVR